jgi:hypothetical protein
MFRSFTSENNLGSFAFCVVDVSEDLLDSRSTDEWTVSSSGIKTETEFEFGDPFFEEFNEPVINRLMNEKTICAKLEY